LLRRIASRDRDALGGLYDQIARPLLAIARRMLGNPEEAEEVIQDVFVQIWIKTAEYDPSKGRPFHWALAIARNRCIDRLRARQRRSRVIADFDDHGFEDREIEHPAPVGPLPESDMAAIRSAVAGLPREQRQAIEMGFFGGMTHPEIAEALHEPLGTVKARIRRGMLKLRDDLREYL
jgi:RNA polymerase sigma-70 factor (ECF subfamily)